MIDLVIDNSFFKFGDKVFRQSIGIPMGIDPAPQMANLCLYYYEAKFMEMLTKENYSAAKKFNYTGRFIDELHTLNNDGHLEENNNMGRIYPQELKLNQENQNDDKATFLDLKEQIKDACIEVTWHMTKEMLSSLKLLITLTFLVISLPNQHMELSHHKSFVMLGSAVRKVICLKGLRASPKNYYGNTTPSMASSHHWRNVWRNIAGSRPNWAQDFTRT